MATVGLSDQIAAASGIVSLIAIGIAVYTLRKSDRNSSVATLIALNDGFRQAWQRFLSVEGERRDYEFAELMNLLEVACAIDKERSLVGVSRELAREYLGHVLELLESDEDAQKRILAAAHDPTTFKYIRLFQARMCRRKHIIRRFAWRGH